MNGLTPLQNKKFEIESSNSLLGGGSYFGATPLNFDGAKNLYVGEKSQSGNEGIIRKVDVATQSLSADIRAFANQRPPWIHALNDGSVFYTGRKEPGGTFGNVCYINAEASTMQQAITTIFSSTLHQRTVTYIY